MLVVASRRLRWLVGAPTASRSRWRGTRPLRVPFGFELRLFGEKPSLVAVVASPEWGCALHRRQLTQRCGQLSPRVRETLLRIDAIPSFSQALLGKLQVECRVIGARKFEHHALTRCTYHEER